MRFGLYAGRQNSAWESQLQMWREADEIAAFESAWTYDHLYLYPEDVVTDTTAAETSRGGVKDRMRAVVAKMAPKRDESFGPCLDGWSTLSALLMTTSRVRGGCLVTGMIYRHPAVLAHMAATVDIISGGRLELGLGTGWSESETAVYGLPLGSWTERYDRFDEGLEVITSLFPADALHYTGDYYSLDGARLRTEADPASAPADPDRRGQQADDQERGALGGHLAGRVRAGQAPRAQGAAAAPSASASSGTTRRSALRW